MLCSEDLRRWFLQNETELFKWRFTHNPPEDMNHWLASNGLRYEAISREERDALRDKLVEMSKCRREEFSEHQEYYKVRFEEVVDLIRQRRVYLRAGYAYVPQSDLVSIVATRVRAFLSKQLSMHARAWPALREEEAERLSTFLEQLATSCAPHPPHHPPLALPVPMVPVPPTLCPRALPARACPG